MRGLCYDAAEWISDEASAPELEACAFRTLHHDTVVKDVAILVADAVDGSDEDAVRDGVGALHRLPGGVLGFAELGFLRGVPADSGGVEEGFRAHQRGDA